MFNSSSIVALAGNEHAMSSGGIRTTHLSNYNK